MTEKLREQMRSDALDIFDSAIKAADPAECVRKVLHWDGDSLFAGDHRLASSEFDRVMVVGGGKAAATMAAAVEGVVGAKLSGGAVITKYGHGAAAAQIDVTEAGHPLPDQAGVDATARMLDLVSQADSRTLVVTVISGGGSALMVGPAEGITLADKQAVTQALLKCGATIDEINAVRKHISTIKGGGLALAAAPAPVVSLILSDVIGDSLDVIASGPTVGDDSTFGDAWDVIDRYGIENETPQTVLHRLSAGRDGSLTDTPRSDDPIFSHVKNALVGTNRLATTAALECARELGYNAKTSTNTLHGEAREIAKAVVALCEGASTDAGPACLILGGETTVTIKGSGKGGRNQELALAAAMELSRNKKIVILSGGTDGNDGPTDAAGGMVDWATTDRAERAGVAVQD